MRWLLTATWHQPRRGLAREEHAPCSRPQVLVVLTPGASRARCHGRPAVGQQLCGGLVKTDHRSFSIIKGLGVKLQHDLHVGHKLTAYLPNAPLRKGMPLNVVGLTPSFDEL